MEHITVSESTNLAASVIPYVGSKAWDQLAFLEYMEREEWNEAQLHGADESCQRSEADILGFLQTWLYFGLLAEACGEKGNRAYFVRASENGHHVLCTTNLRAIHRLEIKRRDKRPKEEFESWQLHLVKCLNTAHSVLAKLAIEKVSYLASPVILGIAALCNFVKMTVLADDMRSECSNLTSGATLFIQNEMADNGWCPTDVRRLSSALDIASLFLAASQPRPDPRKVHTKCSETQCQAYQVKESSYIRAHSPTCDRNNCIDLIVNPAELHAVLLSGSIPITSFYEDENGNPRLRITEASPGTTYVAISHVWSDGFGNPKANALYSCQARRIASYVDSISKDRTGNVPFWLDTLSCPVSPPEATDLAISMMRETYVDAEKVLLMNSHLLDRQKPALCMEILSQLLSCSWTRRLWTLQEGVLAKEIVLQFQDESIEMDTAIGLMQLELQRFLESKSMEYAALLNSMAMLHDLWIRDDKEFSSDRLRMLHAELQWRSTSVPTDEPLCISALLGFPIQDVLKVGIEDRMPQLWSLIRSPPRAVLFWSGDRFEKPGFRWAPASLLATPQSLFSSLKAPAMADPDFKGPWGETKIVDGGLVAPGDGLDLGEWTTAILKGFFVSVGQGRLLWVERQRESGKKKELSSINPPIIQGAGGHPNRRLALLLDHRAERILASNKQGGTVALLVSYDGEGPELIRGHVEDVCYLFPSYFLKPEQADYVRETVDDCIAALTKTDGDVKVKVEAAEVGQEVLGESSTEENEWFYVNRNSEGFTRIEYDKAYWWVQCNEILLEREWLLD